MASNSQAAGILPEKFEVNATINGEYMSEIYFSTKKSNIISENYALGYFLIESIDLSRAAHAESIQLPNGAVYDPYQTYEAPPILGDYSFDCVYISKPNSDPDQRVEIQHQLWTGWVGLRGTMYAQMWTGSYSTCTMRLKSISMGVAGKKYNWGTNYGPKREYLKAGFTFSQLTTWTLP